MKPRLQDIAAILGISVSQVSRALANKNGVAPEIRNAVIAEARRRGYRNDSGRHCRTVAIVFSDISQNTIVPLEKLRKRFKRKKYRVLCLFPESSCFLNDYMVDKVIAFNLLPAHRAALQNVCKKQGVELTDFPNQNFDNEPDG